MLVGDTYAAGAVAAVAAFVPLVAFLDFSFTVVLLLFEWYWFVSLRLTLHTGFGYTVSEWADPGLRRPRGRQHNSITEPG